MSDSSLEGGRVRGVVRDGVVVLTAGHGLADGTEVDVFLAMPKEWEDDAAGWDALSDEAWRLIDASDRGRSREAKRDAG